MIPSLTRRLSFASMLAAVCLTASAATSASARDTVPPAALARAKAANTRLITRYFELFSAKRFDLYEKLWQPDGTFIVGFQLPGVPATTHGAHQIATNFAHAIGAMGKVTVTDLEVMQTTDPNVFVYRHHMRTEYKGRPGAYDNHFISVAHVRNGKLVEIDEYFNVAPYEGFLKAMGVLK